MHSFVLYGKKGALMEAGCRSRRNRDIISNLSDYNSSDEHSLSSKSSSRRNLSPNTLWDSTDGSWLASHSLSDLLSLRSSRCRSGELFQERIFSSLVVERGLQSTSYIASFLVVTR